MIMIHILYILHFLYLLFQIPIYLSHYDYQEGQDDLESPLDYPTLEEDIPLIIDSPLHLILQAFLKKEYVQCFVLRLIIDQS